MKSYAVVTGNFKEFTYYLYELVPEPKNINVTEKEVIAKNGDRYFYCDSIRKVQGLRNWEPIFLGSYLSRGSQFIDEITAYAKVCNL